MEEFEKLVAESFQSDLVAVESTAPSAATEQNAVENVTPE
jgi:hypothetical protein